MKALNDGLSTLSLALTAMLVLLWVAYDSVALLVYAGFAALGAGCHLLTKRWG